MTAHAIRDFRNWVETVGETGVSSLPGNGESILVVDDEPGQCEPAKNMLEHLGYFVTSCLPGEDGVAFMKDHRVDVVLLDM